MKKLIEDIRAFNAKFNLPTDDRSKATDLEWLTYRLDFLEEELQETMLAAELGDVHELLDGLIDLIYVAVGTGVSLGLPLEEAWNRVHAANMQKIKVTFPEESKRGTTYDLLKPEGWKAPSFEDLL